MIDFTAEARAQVSALKSYYADLGRDSAIERLSGHIERASARIAEQRGAVYDAPRPYPALARQGSRWTKEGVYWIAFVEVRGNTMIRAVVHESADIPNRL